MCLCRYVCLRICLSTFSDPSKVNMTEYIFNKSLFFLFAVLLFKIPEKLGTLYHLLDIYVSPGINRTVRICKTSRSPENAIGSCPSDCTSAQTRQFTSCSAGLIRQGEKKFLLSCLFFVLNMSHKQLH